MNSIETSAYTVNPLQVISETLEGETVVINLETGSYFSMNEIGSSIWDHIQKTAYFDALAASLQNTYDADESVVRKDLAFFIEQLLKENLITTAPSASTEVFAASQTKKTYVAPHMDKYEDMQQMLLADPIHDVEEMGWPVLKKNI